MSVLIRKSTTSWIHTFACTVLKSGPIPKHVGFIMDGNRRYARKNGMDRAKGHVLGFEKISETLRWCLDLGINEVTVYAFSIENFKRSKEEVDYLMELARQKFGKLLEERDLLAEHGVRIRVLGNLALLPADLRLVISEAITLTEKNNRAFLNVCLSYTSREELCTAITDIGDALEDGMLEESDITESLINECLYTADCQPLDLVVRTSGEVRLSDFELWQSSYSVLSFMTVLWPDFSRWHLYAAVLYYQQSYAALQKLNESPEHVSRVVALRRPAAAAVTAEHKSVRDGGQDGRVRVFLERLRESRRASLLL